MHEDLLRQHSVRNYDPKDCNRADQIKEFFKVALNGQWKEAQERKITLPEDEPDVVDMYVQWLYGATIEAAVPEAWRETGRVKSIFWAEVYIFSEKIQDRAFANATMEAWTASIDQPFADGIRRFPAASAVSKIYQHTTSGSPVRHFLVHIWVTDRRSHWMTDGYDADLLLGCPEFLLDLARATSPERGRPHQSLYDMRERWLYDV